MRTPAILLALAALAACEPDRRTGAAPPADSEGRLLLDGLGEFGPQIRAAMGTRAERQARAPYSPPGWPFRRGEVVSFERWNEMNGKFPRACGASAAFWVGDMLFGALWAAHGPPRMYQPSVYVGHVRGYIARDPLPPCLRRMPPYLRERPELLYAPPGSRDDLVTGGDGRDKPEWTRERWLEGYLGRDR